MTQHVHLSHVSLSKILDTDDVHWHMTDNFAAFKVAFVRLWTSEPACEAVCDLTMQLFTEQLVSNGVSAHARPLKLLWYLKRHDKLGLPSVHVKLLRQPTVCRLGLITLST